MAERPLTVLVLAVGGNVSQGILKGLAHAQRPYRVLGADISPLQMGLFTVERAFVSPWATAPEFIPWLIDLCKREGVDAILSGCEPVLMALARNHATIEAGCDARIMVSSLEVMEIGDDKLISCAWLAAMDLPHPAYARADLPEDVARLKDEVGYPLIAKPRRGGGSRGIIRVESDDDLAYACRKPGYLLQAHVGTDDDEYTVGCFVDRDGNLAPSCCMRRELLSGTTYRAILGEFTEVREVAERIVTKLQPLGPCNLQLRMTDDGPFCFEINPRFSGSAPLRAHFGYNEAEAVLEHWVKGEPLSLPLITTGVGLRYWNELYPDSDAVAALEATGEFDAFGGRRGVVENYGMNQS